jgi:hypothetical protein
VPEKSLAVEVPFAFPGRKGRLVGVAERNGVDLPGPVGVEAVDVEVAAGIVVVAKITDVEVPRRVAGQVLPVAVAQAGQVEGAQRFPRASTS